MESAKRDKYTGSGTIISEWNPTTTVPACAARCTTSFVLHTAANTGAATGHAVRGERERERERAWKWHADNWQWREWGGS